MNSVDLAIVQNSIRQIVCVQPEHPVPGLFQMVCACDGKVSKAACVDLETLLRRVPVEVAKYLRNTLDVANETRSGTGICFDNAYFVIRHYGPKCDTKTNVFDDLEHEMALAEYLATGDEMAKKMFILWSTTLLELRDRNSIGVYLAGLRLPRAKFTSAFESTLAQLAKSEEGLVRVKMVTYRNSNVNGLANEKVEHYDPADVWGAKIIELIRHNKVQSRLDSLYERTFDLVTASK